MRVNTMKNSASLHFQCFKFEIYPQLGINITFEDTDKMRASRLMLESIELLLLFVSSARKSPCQTKPPNLMQANLQTS